MSRTPRELAVEVAAVMGEVLVHQRPRWGSLLGHKRQFEGWWKAEMTLALESWTWRQDNLKPPMWVRTEVKPRDLGIKDGPPSADILVAPMNDDFSDFARSGPRVWIELKERGTWWGTSPSAAAKAFADGKGILSDLEKWSGFRSADDAVLLCQVTTHDGSYDETDRLPATWTEQLASKGLQPISQSVCVGYEIPDQAAIANKRSASHCVRWARFDAFVLEGR